MNRTLPLLLVLAACVSDNSLSGKDKPEEEFDTETTWEPPDTSSEETGVNPGDEECNGTDDNGDGVVDEGYADDDGDGIANCVDCPVLDLDVAGTVPVLEACEGGATPTIVDPWDVGIEWQYLTSGSGVIVMPAVGNMTDDNGDGVVDDRDVPDIAYTTWGGNELHLLSGDGSGLIFSASGFDGQGGVTIADADADGEPEIVAITTSRQVALVDGTGRTEWTSSSFNLMAYPQPTVADLDADGYPEVIADVAVVNGEDGSKVAELSGIANSWRTPIAADLDQDGTQEIILGNVVYDENGRTEWTNSGTGSGNFAAVADVDGDAGGEVIFVSGSTAYLHDDDGSLIRQWAIPGSNPGPPAMADFDGDGEVEIAIPANTTLSVYNMDGSQVWTSAIRDSSGLAGCSGYDVNGDGAYEVLYADESNMRIYDGTTGAVLYDNPSHDSGTVWEYPVTADVDKDGSAEIIYASNYGATMGITVLGHNGSGWAKSGETWGTHDFAVTNLEPDGGVPVIPEPSWQKYNVFRARPIVDDPASSDLAVRITDVCVATCDAGPVEVAVGVLNQGGADADAGLVVNLYADTDSGLVWVASQALPAVVAGTQIDGLLFELPISALGKYGFVATVDDDGAEGECDESNNSDTWADVYCP